MNSSSGSSVTRNKYREQIHVKGDFGTRTVRRDDEPDYGTGGVDCVVTFTGAVDYRSDCVLGAVSLGDDARDAFIDEIDGRVEEYDIHTFEVEEDS